MDQQQFVTATETEASARRDIARRHGFGIVDPFYHGYAIATYVPAAGERKSRYAIVDQSGAIIAAHLSHVYTVGNGAARVIGTAPDGKEGDYRIDLSAARWTACDAPVDVRAGLDGHDDGPRRSRGWYGSNHDVITICEDVPSTYGVRGLYPRLYRLSDRSFLTAPRRFFFLNHIGSGYGRYWMLTGAGVEARMHWEQNPVGTEPRDDLTWGLLGPGGEELTGADFADLFQWPADQVRVTGRWHLSQSRETHIDYTLSEGFTLASRDGVSWTWLRSDGQLLGEPRFSRVHPFSGGVGAARSRDTGLWGFVTGAGDWSVPCVFRWARSFTSGLAAVQDDRSGKWGYIKADGGWLISPRFDDAMPFSHGLAAIDLAGSWGFVDVSGEIVVQPAYRDVLPFGPAGFAAVEGDGGWGAINVMGRLLVPFEGKSPPSFEPGFIVSWITKPGYKENEPRPYWPDGVPVYSD